METKSICEPETKYICEPWKSIKSNEIHMRTMEKHKSNIYEKSTVCSISPKHKIMYVQFPQNMYKKCPVCNISLKHVCSIPPIATLLPIIVVINFINSWSFWKNINNNIKSWIISEEKIFQNFQCMCIRTI